MQKWEYLHLTAFVYPNRVESVKANMVLVHQEIPRFAYQDYLNMLGSEGWEMVVWSMKESGVYIEYYFKRPIE